MSKNILLIAAIGGAVFLVLQKQAQAATATAPRTTPAKSPQVNVNGDMWASLLGDGWRNLVGAQNPDGSAAFIRNDWGRITTSDGKPVYSGDSIAAYDQATIGLPGGGIDYASDLFPTLDGGLRELGWSLP